MKLDDILKVVKKSEYFHLIIEEGLMDISFYILHIDEFKSDCLSWMRGMVPLV